MKSYISYRSILTAVLVLAATQTGCLKVSTYKAPEVKTPKIEIPDIKPVDLSPMFSTCDKKDSEMPLVSNEVLANKLVVEDQIENQDIEHLNCSGNVVTSKHGPVRELSKSIEIPAPIRMAKSI